MSLLATLRAKKQIREVATLTVATDVTNVEVQPSTVAKVAPVDVVRPEETPWAANAPDLWCWLHSPAIDTTEIDAFMERLAIFADKGVSYDEAEALADKLVTRDREGDDRRLCLECTHLQGFGRWRCGNWQAADVAQQELARDLVLTLQRCGGFGER